MHNVSPFRSVNQALEATFPNIEEFAPSILLRVKVSMTPQGGNGIPYAARMPEYSRLLSLPLCRSLRICRVFVHFQPFQLRRQRLVFVDPEQAGGLSFDAVRFAHRAA